MLSKFYKECEEALIPDILDIIASYYDDCDYLLFNSFFPEMIIAKNALNEIKPYAIRYHRIIKESYDHILYNKIKPLPPWIVHRKLYTVELDYKRQETIDFLLHHEWPI